MNTTDFVGKRVLLKVGKDWSSTVEEYRILESSPSGNFVRLMNWNGYKFWKATVEVAFVEELKDLKAERAGLQNDLQTGD